MEETSDSVLFNIQNKILEGSPSSDIYNVLNEKVNESQYDEKCKTLQNTQNNVIEGSYELCKQILRNAKNLSERYNRPKYNYHCSHYKHWVYNKLKEILGNNSENSKLKTLISKFSEARKNIVATYNAQFCKFELEHNTLQELNDKIEEKYLFDYFENYDSIKTYSTCQSVSFDKYKEYISNISKLYSKHKSKNKCCIDSFWSDCPDYFKCQNEFDPNTLLSSLNDKNNNNCDILKTLEKPSEPSNSLNSQRDFKDSVYLFRCTDITDDIYGEGTRKGGARKCHVFSASPNSLNNRYSPYNDSFYRVHRTTSVLTEKLGSNKAGSDKTNSLESTGKQSEQSQITSSHSGILDQEEAKKTVEQDCAKYGLVKGILGGCREPSIRETLMIGAKRDTYAPQGRVTYSPEGITVLLRNSDIKSNIFNNNILRFGIAFTLIVGITSIIYMYYKFTPFGRRFHKKVPKKRRIDDYYYDDPHMRHFIIRAPKSDKRKAGSRRLRFSYYSR
ncbi:PIR Superfamily Protein [Plasmodium malariae]|uniref:PIR Superfamily Protein n=1 Tax=Plasmodium malariae TaxID=5858 RepID=A0A1A8XA31_PLAMA|nr:PIR Superfamily Protein [Plasmodium malariae]